MNRIKKELLKLAELLTVFAIIAFFVFIVIYVCKKFDTSDLFTGLMAGICLAKLTDIFTK